MPHRRPKLKFRRNELIEVLDEFGMTGTNAADFLEKDRKSITRWRKGESPIPVEVAMLFALMREVKTKPNNVRKLVGLAPITLGDARVKDDDEPKAKRR